MKVLLIIAFLTCASTTIAQTISKKLELQEGNDAYVEGKYDTATIKYERARGDGAYYKADYNQANTLYKQDKFEESTDRFSALVKSATTKKEKAAAAHNLGNSYLSQKKYKEAITAYKNSLKNDPAAEDTRYNLAYALQKLKDQQNEDQQDKDQQDKDQQDKDQQDKDQQDKDQQNKDQQNKDQQNKDQQNKDQQDKDQQNKDQQNKDQQNKDQQNKDQQNKDQQKSPSEKGKISRQQALKDLDAINNDEKKTLLKLQKKKAKETKNKQKSDKDW